ncbi:hypothetical protein N7493_008895 [Penicillium malachiteum]|uniref:Major facilitator superfamily (MFS) profile domain-containing protein n=1 Tax=Penicillium malachiteum TaxID=1324776 RepID=A0AAD6MT36_9EURO|nr:hypothetical protein N7493_008895 [Penicillium malachiteum]
MSVQSDKDDFPLKSPSQVPVAGLLACEAREPTPEQPKTPSLPPNGGGVVNTFGIYQSYYEETLLSSHSASSISWIGTIQGFLLFLVGVIVGPVFDKGYLKSLVATGSFLVVFLAHGVAVGIGCAFLFLPSIAIVATYFTSRRAIATGITASGGSIGAVIYPIMFHKLINVGFG